MLAVRWEFLLKVRGEVTRALEAARTQKLIGHPLDAAVTISAKGAAFDTLEPLAGDLRSLLIVSEADLVREQNLDGAFSGSEIEDLEIKVTPAPGEKCERCWVHDTTVGTNSEQPSICSRCQDALARIG